MHYVVSLLSSLSFSELLNWKPFLTGQSQMEELTPKFNRAFNFRELKWQALFLSHFEVCVLDQFSVLYSSRLFSML